MASRSIPALARTSLALSLLASVGAAQAVDWTGYIRGGPGLTSNNTSRACYGLNGGSSGMKYRLGNECDFYGEFQLAQGFKKEGIDARVVLMTNQYTPATEPSGDEGLKIEQLFAEAKGFDFAPEATFWIGKERGRRGDVHIVDTFFTEMAGVGAGAKGFKAGPGELGMAYYKTDSKAPRLGHRGNLEWVGINSNRDGKLNFFGTLTKGQFTGGTKGFGLSMRHDQSKLFGTALNNTLWLQYAQGSTALNSNFGDLSASSKAKSWRVVESINWQTGALGGQAILLWADEKNSLGQSTKSASVGGRLSYGITRHFKLLGEVGLSQYKPEGGETARLTKITLAPTLSMGPNFFDRPEFRLYVTHGRWNRAAGNVTGQPGFANETAGTSYGAQLEWWF